MTLLSFLRSGVEHVLSAAPRRTKRGDRLILSYHNIVPQTWTPRGDASLHLSAERFHAQLRILRLETDVVPLIELLRLKDRSSRLAAVTFDDAYLGAVSQGVDLCLQEGAPCTVFVAPHLLGKLPAWDRNADAGKWSISEREAFLWKARGLSEPVETAMDSNPCRIATEEELAVLVARPGVSIGNHTMRHANLGSLPFGEACEELSHASNWLSARFSKSFIPVAAYPYGIPPADADAVLRKVGLQFGLMVQGGWMSAARSYRVTHIPRWNVPAAISDQGFWVRARGRLADA